MMDDEARFQKILVVALCVARNLAQTCEINGNFLDTPRTSSFILVFHLVALRAFQTKPAFSLTFVQRPA